MVGISRSEDLSVDRTPWTLKISNGTSSRAASDLEGKAMYESMAGFSKSWLPRESSRDGSMF